jgi:outer membrane lipoprotein SlyB
MRLVVVGLLMGVAAVAACSPVYRASQPPITLARVDQQDAADRAAVGSVVGATLGAGLGAAFALDPGLGATVGVEVGGPVGAIVGAATAQPLPDYQPIPVPTAAVIPDFYDTWPPGYDRPPVGTAAPPPPLS